MAADLVYQKEAGGGTQRALLEWPCLEYVYVPVINYKRVAAGGSSQHLTGSPSLPCSEYSSKSDHQSTGGCPWELATNTDSPTLPHTCQIRISESGVQASVF